jgi:hypothetical protein
MTLGLLTRRRPALVLLSGSESPNVVIAPQMERTATAMVHEAYQPRSMSAPLTSGATMFAVDISD